MSNVPADIKLVLPKKGQLIIEDFQEFVMCKPRLIPLKSFTLEKLEKMQQEVHTVQEDRTSEDSRNN